MYWVAQSRDIGRDGEGFDQTNKDVTFVRNELDDDVEARWMDFMRARWIQGQWRTVMQV